MGFLNFKQFCLFITSELRVNNKKNGFNLNQIKDKLFYKN